MEIENELENIRKEVLEFLESANRQKLSIEKGKYRGYYSAVKDRLSKRKSISLNKILKLKKELNIPVKNI
jgi:hypothetical protein